MSIAAIQFGLTLTLLPTILNKNAQVPFWTSGPATLGLYALAAIFGQMGMMEAFASSFLCAVAWTFIALCRTMKEVPDAATSNH